MSVKISDSWIKHLDKEFQKDYFFEIIKNVKHEYSNYKCFPKGNDIFKAFDLCSFEKIKVIIVGQDPYHGDNQANGLCFSVNKGIDCPPSLKNIFKEIHNNFGLERINPDFSDLAKQGVLLLNSVLTVRRKFPGSHKYVGWETFTDKVLEIISEKKDNLVFMLWGNYAKNKKKLIELITSSLKLKNSIFLEILCSKGNRPNLSRPKKKMITYKKLFINFVK